MNLLCTQEEFDKAGYKDLLPLKCNYCNNTFYKSKRGIQCVKKSWGKNQTTWNYCSQLCHAKHTGHPPVQTTCNNCNKAIIVPYSKFQKRKWNFCSKQCLGYYTSQHKTHGYRRSKLEKWLEEQLKILYPNLEVHYNKLDTIGVELDIYFPSLKLAVELNGPFHYEPIYGKDQLERTQNRDKIKGQLCLEKNIEFCSIDTSKQRNFKEKTAKVYLDIITDILNQKLNKTIIQHETNKC